MGSKTFEADPRKAASDHLLVVMTRNPEKYEAAEVKGQLEFTSESPADLFSRFEKNGCTQMLIAGRPHIATLFLKENLIDELWLTIEPKIFGTGESFATKEKLDISLKLIHSEWVNEQGTLITKYEVLRK
jgi:dihydrofolate reductase